MLMTREKGFYRRLALLVAPLALQNVISFSVGLADNLMIGSLGELALSGVYVANQLQNLLQMMVIGLSAAMAVLASQYWGKRDREHVKIIVGIALKFSLAAGALFLLFTLIMPSQIMHLFTNEDAVVAESRKYLDVLRWSYLFFCVTQVLIASMRCVETVRIGLYTSIMTFCVNVFLNWVLIFGNLGAPALGVRGAAIATLIARILEFLVINIYIRLVDKKLEVRFADLWKSDRELLARFFKYGLPVILGDIFWGVNLAMQGAIVGRLGSTALASVSIANVIFSIFSVVAYGVAGASAVVIGQTVGAGNYVKVKEYARTLQVLFLGIGLFSGTALFIAKDFLHYFYNVNDATMTMTVQFLTVLSVTLVGTAYQMATLTGIVRAGGATHFVLVNDLIFVWCIVIPSALLAAFVFHASPVVVFACLKSDQILKCLVAVVKVNRFRWMKNLTLAEPAKALLDK